MILDATKPGVTVSEVIGYPEYNYPAQPLLPSQIEDTSVVGGNSTSDNTSVGGSVGFNNP